MGSGSDQAAGLRRLLAAPGCRTITLLSAVEADERDMLVINLAASLAHFGQRVVLLDASHCQGRIARRLGATTEHTLLDVATEVCELSSTLQAPRQGLQFLELSRGRRIGVDAEKRIEALLDQVMGQCDVLLTAAELDQKQRLPVGALASGEILVQVSRRPNAITAGYSAIKSLTRVTGRRSFGVLITDTPEADAKTLHANMAEAASRFLAVSLGFVGSIPPDDSVRRACDMKRSVIELFPLAEASAALRRISEAIVQASDPKLPVSQRTPSMHASPA